MPSRPVRIAQNPRISRTRTVRGTRPPGSGRGRTASPPRPRRGRRCTGRAATAAAARGRTAPRRSARRQPTSTTSRTADPPVARSIRSLAFSCRRSSVNTSGHRPRKRQVDEVDHDELRQHADAQPERIDRPELQSVVDDEVARARPGRMRPTCRAGSTTHAAAERGAHHPDRHLGDVRSPPPSAPTTSDDTSWATTHDTHERDDRRTDVDRRGCGGADRVAERAGHAPRRRIGHGQRHYRRTIGDAVQRHA